MTSYCCVLFPSKNQMSLAKRILTLINKLLSYVISFLDKCRHGFGKWIDIVNDGEFKLEHVICKALNVPIESLICTDLDQKDPQRQLADFLRNRFKILATAMRDECITNYYNVSIFWADSLVLICFYPSLIPNVSSAWEKKWTSLTGYCHCGHKDEAECNLKILVMLIVTVSEWIEGTENTKNLEPEMIWFGAIVTFIDYCWDLMRGFLFGMWLDGLLLLLTIIWDLIEYLLCFHASFIQIF